MPNIPLALVPVIVFYLNMHPTHRVLLAAKKAELKKVRRRMAEAYDQMPPAMESGDKPWTSASSSRSHHLLTG